MFHRDEGDKRDKDLRLKGFGFPKDSVCALFASLRLCVSGFGSYPVHPLHPVNSL